MAGEPTDSYDDIAHSRSIYSKLLNATDRHDIEGIRKALEMGADINQLHPDVGLAALHVAVGNNDLVLCRFLIEDFGAEFFPDRFGRWPTLIAAECRVDEALCDYIVEQEARALGQDTLAEVRD